MVKRIIIAFLAWKIIILFFLFLATLILPFQNTFTPFRNLEVFDKRLSYPFVIWGNFDGIHYIQIAQRGYQLLEQPFFPLYPVLIRFTSTLLQLPFLLGSQLVSNISFLLFLIVAGKLLFVDRKGKLFPLFLTIIFVFPTSFFYSAAYNDSLFLLLATLTLYFGRKQKWFLGMVFSALATLTRLNGLALIFFLFFEFILQNKKMSNKPLRLLITGLFFSFLPLVSFIGYLVYVQKVFKNWNLVFSTMQIWGQSQVTFPLQVFWRYFKMVFLHPSFNQLNYYVAVFELVFVIFYIYLIIYSYAKIRFSYWIFFVISIIIPSLTGTFQGMPRYGLHLYPFFLVLTLYFSGKSLAVKLVFMGIALIVMLFYLTLFSRGYFIA